MGSLRMPLAQFWCIAESGHKLWMRFFAGMYLFRCVTILSLSLSLSLARALSLYRLLESVRYG